MPKVQYVGISHYREITKADWESVGVDDQEAVRWDRDNRRDKEGFSQVVEVSDGAATFLMEKEPKGDFAIVNDNGPISLPSLVAGGELTHPDQPLYPAPEEVATTQDNPQA